MTKVIRPCFVEGDGYLIALAFLVLLDTASTLKIGTELNPFLLPLANEYGLAAAMCGKLLVSAVALVSVAILGRLLRKSENRRFSYKQYTSFALAAYILIYLVSAGVQFIKEVI